MTATQLRSKQWLVGIQFVITIITRNRFKKKKGNVIRYNYMITFLKYKGWFKNKLSPNITSLGTTNGPNVERMLCFTRADSHLQAKRDNQDQIVGEQCSILNTF